MGCRVQGGAYDKDSLCVGLARVGAEDQQIVAGSMQELLNVDFGAPLHSLIIAGQTHAMEDEVLQLYRYSSSAVDQALVSSCDS